MHRSGHPGYDDDSQYPDTDDAPPLSMTDLRKTVGILRDAAQRRIQTDRLRLWPAVSDRDFNAVVSALGEISVVEAREALARLQQEGCICEIDCHNFNCPVHNDIDHPKRGPNGDEP
jgi:hypothetical protein